MEKNEIVGILKDKRIQWGIVIVLLLIALFWSSSIRLSNWDLLTDQTTGEKIPIALDPFYFLRVSETIIKNGGSLPSTDVMRYPAANVEFSPEILSKTIVLLFNVANIFGEYSIQEVDIFSPVAFYFVGLIFFFFLVYTLTKSKSSSLISSVFLAFIPSYLYRTLAGFSDHDSIGTMSFFIAALAFILTLSYIEKNKGIKSAGLCGLIAAFFSTFALVSWGGIANFVFMIFPFSFFILWLFKIKKERDFLGRGLLFYFIWVLFTALFGIVFSYSPLSIFTRFFLSTSGLISLFVLGYVFIDYLMIKYQKKIKFLAGKNRELCNLVVVVIVGILGLTFLGKNVFEILSEIWIKLFHPWGLGRVGLTVAENAQPYLPDWISASGPVLFWIFFGGMLLFGWEVISRISSLKRKIAGGFCWILLLCSLLFSRISPSSIMNGTNFVSQLFYIGGLLIFVGFFIWIYFKEDFSLDARQIFIFSWMLFTLIASRAAIRMFFAITPLVCFFAGYVFFRILVHIKETKEETLKRILIVLLVLLVIVCASRVYSYKEVITSQAAGTGPSANYQWQEAMSWVRDNTPENSIFIHWWDYGYWVEYLGERPAVTDGGHAIGYWDHLIGRYLLTTQDPETAYSLMKTYNVSYLLIDQTDLGKYGAYSKIGSDTIGEDRYSAIPVMALDPRQTTETANKTIRFYPGGIFVDEDISYSVNEQQVFLPSQKSGMLGVFWEMENSGGSQTAKQPIGVYSYNNKRYDIPIRYVYFNGKIEDFGGGIEAVVKVIPYFDGSQFDNLGALIYLSPKVSKGLFAQVYLLNDIFGNYKDIKLVHSEDDIVVSSLKSQGAPLDDFIFYQGFRGPIKIWEVNYPENTLEREEFLRTDGDWAEFDNLEFVK
ncbi:MAG: hypothetical protein NUV97_02605 [archaeon]|nr:hypothetical protein [archaeon]MCR4323970.1 hypothetical protein [Nanoarchaeota archaeon]